MEPPTPTRQSTERVNYDDMCGSGSHESLYDVVSPDNMFDDSHQNVCDDSPPADTRCQHRLSDGSDSLSVTLKSKPNVRNIMFYRVSTGNQKKLF